jgi:hypothetical protein
LITAVPVAVTSLAVDVTEKVTVQELADDVTAAETALADDVIANGTDQELADDVTAAEALVTARTALNTAVTDAETALADDVTANGTDQELADAVTAAETALADDVTANGTDQELADDLAAAEALVTARTALNTAVSDAQDAVDAGGTASDSHPSNTGDQADVIHHFSLANDKLDLPTTDILTGINNFSVMIQNGTVELLVSVTDGLATFTGDGAETATQGNKIYALLTAMGTETAAAAFVHPYNDTYNTFVVYGDGVAGSQDSDILVVLAGVADTTSLATGAGGDALVIM